ncbi:MAG: hypothetical protein QOK02_6276 [Mycobacterium sp.]|nr:hypothetical protein [Mycobacterium sp.]
MAKSILTEASDAGVNMANSRPLPLVLRRLVGAFKVQVLRLVVRDGPARIAGSQWRTGCFVHNRPCGSRKGAGPFFAAHCFVRSKSRSKHVILCESLLRVGRFLSKHRVSPDSICHPSALTSWSRSSGGVVATRWGATFASKSGETVYLRGRGLNASQRRRHSNYGSATSFQSQPFWQIESDPTRLQTTLLGGEPCPV